MSVLASTEPQWLCNDAEWQAEQAIQESKNKRTALASEVESASAELERLKATRIAAAEQALELRSELETKKAGVNFKKAKLSSQQQDIFKSKTTLNLLKDEEAATRESFISIMIEINKTAREMQMTHSRPPLRPDNRSTSRDSANPSCEPGVAKTCGNVIDEVRARHDERVCELLREICMGESVLLPLKSNLDCQQEKLQNRRQKHAGYIESIDQATEDLASAKNQSQELEDQVSALTTDLQDMYVCPQCGTDNLGQATG